MFNPMLTSIIKRQITKSIETKIISVFESGDEKITRHLDERRRSLLELQNQYKTVPLEETRRPGLFSHIVNVLNRKVNSIWFLLYYVFKCNKYIWQVQHFISDAYGVDKKKSKKNHLVLSITVVLHTKLDMIYNLINRC